MGAVRGGLRVVSEIRPQYSIAPAVLALVLRTGSEDNWSIPRPRFLGVIPANGEMKISPLPNGFELVVPRHGSRGFLDYPAESPTPAPWRALLSKGGPQCQPIPLSISATCLRSACCVIS